MEILILESSEATLAEMITSAEARDCTVVFSASFYDRFSEKQMNIITFYLG